MAHLIDKDALVAEIERRIKEYQSTGDDYWFPVIENLKSILSFLDALEVKEVDLDFQMFAKEMDAIFALPSSETDNTEENPFNWEYAIAKHFFELGVNASNPLTWEDIDWIVGEAVCRVTEDSEAEQICKEVLKLFKAQKGE